MPSSDKAQEHDGTRQQMVGHDDQTRYPFRIAIRTPSPLPVGTGNALIPAGALLQFTAELTPEEALDVLLAESNHTDVPNVCDYLVAELPVSRRLIETSDVADELPNIAKAYSEASGESWGAKAYRDIDLPTMHLLLSMLTRCAVGQDEVGMVCDYSEIQEKLQAISLSPDSFMDQDSGLQDIWRDAIRICVEEVQDIVEGMNVDLELGTEEDLDHHMQNLEAIIAELRDIDRSDSDREAGRC